MRPGALLGEHQPGRRRRRVGPRRRASQRPALAGAAVDTFVDEPYHGELVEVDTCLMTAHMGSMAADCRRRMECGAARNVVAFLRGEPLDEPVPESEYAVQRRRRRRNEADAMAVRPDPRPRGLGGVRGVRLRRRHDRQPGARRRGRPRVGGTASRADGLGVQMLSRAGVGCLILSTETNPVVSARAAKLGVECVQGLGDAKGEALRGDPSRPDPRPGHGWPTSATTSTTSSASSRSGSRSAWPTPGPPSGGRRASSPSAGAAPAPFARSATSCWRPVVGARADA